MHEDAESPEAPTAPPDTPIEGTDGAVLSGDEGGAGAGGVGAGTQPAPGEAIRPVDEGAPVGDAASTGPIYRVVEVTSVTFDLPGPGPVVHVRESESPYRGFHFPIGLPEAQAIALALEHEVPPRPGTHDLFSSTLVAMGADVAAVRLTGARDGTVLAELELSSPRGREVLDCRPSDGIALALRQAVVAPVLCEDSLLDD